MGLPYVLEVRGNGPVLQTPDAITITYQNDNQRRFVRLNAPHSAHPVPSWFGEYRPPSEGDTLVIDTVGIAVHEFSVHGFPHLMLTRLVARSLT